MNKHFELVKVHEDAMAGLIEADKQLADISEDLRSCEALIDRTQKRIEMLYNRRSIAEQERQECLKTIKETGGKYGESKRRVRRQINLRKKIHELQRAIQLIEKS